MERSEDARNQRHDDSQDLRAMRNDRSRRATDPEQNGKDWRDYRDSQAGRSTSGSSATDQDRSFTTDREPERPVHAGAGPASTVGRSSSFGPVLSGAATAFVLFLIFSALWAAIAASGAEAVGDNLEWFQLISGIVAAAAGGAVAGWLDPRGAVTGMIQGLATWGLLVLAVTIAGITTGTAVLGAAGNVTLDANIEVANVTQQLQPYETELWALFAVLIGGALIAGMAGALTGRTHTKMALDDQRYRDEGHGRSQDRTSTR